MAGVTAPHRAFNIKGLGLQPHPSLRIDAKSFSGALTNLGWGPTRCVKASARRDEEEKAPELEPSLSRLRPSTLRSRDNVGRSVAASEKGRAPNWGLPRRKNSSGRTDTGCTRRSVARRCGGLSQERKRADPASPRPAQGER
jgi:hypothetical protein